MEWEWKGSRPIEQEVSLRHLDLPALAVGNAIGSIQPTDAIRIELMRLKTGIALTADEERIALTLSDDVDVVREILERNLPSRESRGRASRVWLYQAANQIRNRWRGLLHPELALEEILDSMDSEGYYREVRLHDPPPGIKLGKRHHRGRLDEVLKREGIELTS